MMRQQLPGKVVGHRYVNLALPGLPVWFGQVVYLGVDNFQTISQG